MNKEMDCCTDVPAVTQSQGSQTILSRVRSWIVTPRGLTIAGIAAIAIGLALNWGWLVAVGAAPIILALAPCAVMCALGLCMMPRGNSLGTPAPSDQVTKPVQVPPASETALSHRLEDQHASLPN
jgi:hypothetical protein